MYRLYLFFLICYQGIQLQAQTQLGLVLGADALKLSDIPFDYQNCYTENPSGCIERGYQIHFPLFGIQLEQQISAKKHLSLVYQGVYTKRIYEYLYLFPTFAYALYGDKVELDYYFHQLSFQKNIWKGVNFNLGLGFQQYRNMTAYMDSLQDPEILEIRKLVNNHQIGTIIGTSYHWKGLRIQAQYFHSLSASNNTNWAYTWDAIPIDPARGIQVSIGYVFTLFDCVPWFSSTKEGCPTD